MSRGHGGCLDAMAVWDNTGNCSSQREVDSWSGFMEGEMVLR